jgi:hypothetical protein
MKSLLLFLTTAILSLTLGCASGVKIPPGKSAVEIAVRAEPKKGYHPENAAASYAGGPGDQLTTTANPAGQYAPLDYAGLYGIIIWLEPVTGTAPAATPQNLPLASPNPKQFDDSSPRVGTIGDKLIILNRSTNTDTFYLRFDDGSIADIGTIGGGKSGAYLLKRPGAQSVVSDSLDRPIDRLFVTPSPLYKVAHCNSTITFNDLAPGEYRLKSWHYRLPGSTASLTLAPNKSTKATVIVGVNALPKVP